jgi:formylglycine-generating enzyme required for sulfatase activity
MKSPWPVVFVVAALAFPRITQADSDEPGNKAPAPAVDPMLGREAGQVRDDNGLQAKLVWCPPGFVTMEQVEVITEPVAEKEDAPNDDDIVDPKDEPDPRKTERITPIKVFMTKGYWLGKYEITQSAWKQVMQTEPWKGQKFTKDGDDFPATYISWDDAMAFCRKLTKQERQAGRLPDGWEYTLPTEAQWERACRARTETRFSYGDDESKLGGYAWFRDNAWDAREQYAHRVGLKKPNPWGLHDMHGNAQEWCRDWMADDQRLPGGRDPEVTARGSYSSRVIRGGCWSTVATRCRSAQRHSNSSDDRDWYLGFRLALSSAQSVK